MRYCYISVTAILGAILPFLKIQPCVMAQMKGFFGLCNNGVAFTYWNPSSKAIFFITKRFLKYFCGGHFGRHFAISKDTALHYGLNGRIVWALNNGVAFTYWKPSSKAIFLRKMRFCNISVTAILAAILPFLKIQLRKMAQIKEFFGLYNNGLTFIYWKVASKGSFSMI